MAPPEPKPTLPNVAGLRQLSEETSFIYKIIPAVMVIACVAVVPFFAFGPPSPSTPLALRFFAPPFFVAMAVAACWYIGPIREVWLGPNGFIVGSWVKKIEVPFSNVATVISVRWLNPERITLVLKTPGKFGARIHFLPTQRLFPFFSPHPTYLQIVDLLRQRNGPPAS